MRVFKYARQSWVHSFLYRSHRSVDGCIVDRLIETAPGKVCFIGLEMFVILRTLSVSGFDRF